MCRLAGSQPTAFTASAISRWPCGVPARAMCSASAPTVHFGSWRGKPPVAGAAAQIAQGLASSAWRRLSAGEGTKGTRLDDWAYCELADLDAAEYDEERSGLWTRGLLIRRNIDR